MHSAEPPSTFAAQLVSKRLVTPRVAQLTFERSDSTAFHFMPGQWVSINFPTPAGETKPLRRSYSIASAPDDRRFELLVTHVDGGPGSTLLHQAEVGARFEVKGPQGHFSFAFDKPCLMVASGTGYAPFRSMLLHACRRPLTHPVWLLLGFRAPGDRLGVEELAQLALAQPLLNAQVTLSQPSTDWSGLSGRVQPHVASVFAALVAHSSSPPQVLLCGVRAMLTDVRNILKTQFSLERQRISAESYD
jgi:NAD(P)H-flavin reductase